MSRRTTVRTLLALGVSAAAISTGAIVTSQAMAGASTPATGKVTVATVSADGTGAVQCQYDDIELPDQAEIDAIATAVAGEGPEPAFGLTAPIPLPATAAPVEGWHVVGGAVAVTSADVSEVGTEGSDDGPTLHTSGPVAAGVAPFGIEGVDGQMAGVRPGTDEECAAMRPTLAVPASAADAVPVGPSSVRVGPGAGSGAGGSAG